MDKDKRINEVEMMLSEIYFDTFNNLDIDIDFISVFVDKTYFAFNNIHKYRIEMFYNNNPSLLNYIKTNPDNTIICKNPVIFGIFVLLNHGYAKLIKDIFKETALEDDIKLVFKFRGIVYDEI